MRTARWLVLASLLALGACGSERGDKEMGEECSDAEECAHGLCVAGVAGPDPVCTRSCANTSECPRGWSCSGVTQGNVLICQRGAGNPLGVGARE